MASVEHYMVGFGLLMHGAALLDDLPTQSPSLHDGARRLAS
jgi:hypothetical protein